MGTFYANGQHYSTVEETSEAELNDAEPNEFGFHPEYGHLAWYYIERHHGSYIVTSPARDGSLLVSGESLSDMFGECAEDGAYAVDEYLDQFEAP